MTDNNTLLRTTTISLDEYNKLKTEADSLKALNGGQSATINILNSKVSELQEKQPQVKVIHYTREYENSYNEWNDEMEEHPYDNVRKVEFVNLTDVTNLALSQAKAGVKAEVEQLKKDLEGNKYTIKQLRDNVDTVQDRLDAEMKHSKKASVKYLESLEEEEEKYNKNVKLLEKAAKEDSTNYKETIKELKEEIQKVKDSKTDKEVEEKRNKEIRDLKLRIKDLESTIDELGKLNFVKRIFKLRTISAEKLAAQKELLERKSAVDKIGTTWVSKGGKYRKYDNFKETMNNIFHITLSNSWNALKGWF